MLKDMKFVKFTAVALFATLMMVGCSPAGLENGGVGGNEASNTGTLSIATLTIDCRIDESEPESGILSTRTTGAVDANDFLCSIINESNEVVLAFKYGERPTEDITLPTGDYIFKIQSGEVQGAAWDSPVYGATKAFKIVRNETTQLSEVVCSLMQIKVTITYAPDLLERLGDKTITTAKVGNNSLEFSLTEERAGFFLAPQLNNTIELCISGTYAADKVNFKEVVMNKEVRNVKAGQHSKIHLYIEHASEGNINVEATIRDWVTDEVVPCNVADLVKEEEWKENTGNEGGDTTVEDPNIVWEGYDISKREQIVAGMRVDLLITASKGIKELTCEINSASLTPAELADTGLCNLLNLCYPALSYDTRNPETFIDVEGPLRGLGFAVAEDVLNQTSVKLSITQFMGVLQAVSGSDLKHHDFILTVTDNEGNTTVKTLMLQTGK